MKLIIRATMMLFAYHLSLFSAPIVHVFGDSHSVGNFKTRPSTIISSFFYEDQDKKLSVPFHINMLGPRTMHGIGKNGLAILNLREFDVQEGDVAVFVFGEIDVRVHIGKQRDQHKRDLNEIINTLVLNYVETIKKNKQLYNNITCVITSVLPPTDQCNNPSYPRYGTLADRVNITRQLNQRLKEACTQERIEFLDIHDFYANSDGSLNIALSDGQVHVNLRANKPIKIKLTELLLSKGILNL